MVQRMTTAETKIQWACLTRSCLSMHDNSIVGGSVLKTVAYNTTTFGVRQK